MLQVIRDRAQGVVIWTVVGLIIATFALWGVSSYFRGDKGIKVATVDGKDVSTNEYRIAYQQERNRLQQMLGANFDPDMFEAQLKQSALERVIDNRVLIQNGVASGLRISDAQLAGQIQALAPFQTDGQFSKALYEQQLRTQGESPTGFERRVRNALLADQLILGVTASEFATKKELEELYRLQEQKRTIGYFTIPLEDFKKDVKVSDDEIKDFYEKNQDRYQTPELVSVEYVELSAKALAKQITVDEAEVKKYFESQKHRFVVPEERRASHILIQVAQEAGDDVVEKARKKAQDLYDRIKKGEAFDKLAKKNSDDPGSAEQGGDLGFFARGIMDESFEKAAFQLKVGEVGEPVRSRFGFHIIKLTDIHAEQQKPYEKVHAELETQLRQQKAEAAYFEKAETLANLAYEHPESLQSVSEELGLKVKTSAPFTRSGGPGVASNAKVAQAAFSKEVLEDRFNSEPIETAANESVVLRLKEHKPAATRPLEQVKSAIENELANRKARDKAQEKGQALVAEITNGKDETEVAKTFKYKWQKVDGIKRDDTKSNTEVVHHAFAMKLAAEGKKAVDGFALGSGDYVVVRLFDVKDGDPAGMDEAKKESLEKNLASGGGAAQFQSLLTGLKDNAKIERFPNNL